MEYGFGSGLNFTVNYNDRINQLHANEQLDRRARSDAEARAALLASDSEFQNAMNSHDSAIIKENARTTIKKMGEYRRNNPDMLYNPDKLVQFNLMKRELRDNPDLIRGVSSDNNYKEYTKDLQEVAKNPQMHDVGAYEEIKKQWGNYLQYGNQNGLEAAQKEGKKAFLYSKPQDFVDMPATLEKLGDGIKNYNVIKGSNIGEFWTEPKPEEVDAIKKSVYQQHGRQLQVQAAKLGLKTPEEIDAWVTKGISAGFKKNYSIGDANALWERNYKMQQLGLEKQKLDDKKGGPTYTPFDHLIDPRNRAGNVPVELVRKIWNDRPKMELIGVDGKKVDLTGYDLNYDGRFVKNKQNIPFLLGNVKLPLAVAIEKGIVKEKGVFSDDDAPGAYDIRDISSSFLGQAKIQTDVDKNGKSYQYVNVDYHLPIDPKGTTERQMYNAQADVDKLVPASKDPYASSSSAAAPQVYEGSPSDFKAKGYTDDQIREGIQRGLIKLR